MQNYDILALAGLRIDGRRSDDLRLINHKIGFIQSADGSAYLEQGLNKVLVMVHGPQEPKKKQNDQYSENCSIVCRVINAPFSGTEWKKRRTGDRRNLETENVVRQITEEIVVLDIYPRSEIHVIVHILESDGSTICCIINALCLALMDAGISMTDMMAACTVGYVKKDLCLDLTQIEQNAGGAYIPIVMKARSEEIIFMQLDSRLSLDDLDSALAKCVTGCRKIKAYVESAIKKDMMKVV